MLAYILQYDYIPFFQDGTSYSIGNGRSTATIERYCHVICALVLAVLLPEIHNSRRHRWHHVHKVMKISERNRVNINMIFLYV